MKGNAMLSTYGRTKKESKEKIMYTHLNFETLKVVMIPVKLLK